MHHKEDRNRLASPTTNDFCSALALDACCMQTAMKRKVCWFVFFSVLLFPCRPGTLSHLSHMNHSNIGAFVCVTDLPWERGRISWFALGSASADRGDVEEQGEGFRNAESWLQAPLLISASSLFCMNVSCHWKREIKMVVCISRWVAVSLPAFSSRVVLFPFFYFLLVSHEKTKS